MIHEQDWAERVAAWQAGQAAFWSAAMGQTDRIPDAVGPEGWAVDPFAKLAAALQRMEGPWPQTEAARLGAALLVLSRLVARTWEDIATDVTAERLAGSARVETWPDLRALWFRTAEQAFLQLLRRPAYVTAQTQALRALIALWRAAPMPVQALLSTQARLAQQGARSVTETLGQAIPIAQTGADTIWQNGKTSLARYRPLAERRPGPPVLLCHGLIGRQTMTDLTAGRSLVRKLLRAGVDLFVLDWGNAGPEDAELGLDHYAGTQLGAALEAAITAAGQPRAVLFGICQGGTLAACHAAHWSDKLSGLITAVAPFDFHADQIHPQAGYGLLNLWSRALCPEDIDSLVAPTGLLPGAVLGGLFDLMNPIKTLRKYTVDLFQQTPETLPAFLAMERWIADRPDLSAALAKTWFVDLYQRNALIQGGLHLDGRPVDLARIRVPVLNIYATQDHIVPAACARALSERINGPLYSELVLPTGHIGTFVSTRAQDVLAPGIVEWLHTIL